MSRRTVALPLLLSALAGGILGLAAGRRFPARPPDDDDLRVTDGGEEVFVKTPDAPQGRWVELVGSDDTPVVQFSHHRAGRFVLYHESGRATWGTREDVAALTRDGRQPGRPEG